MLCFVQISLKKLPFYVPALLQFRILDSQLSACSIRLGIPGENSRREELALLATHARLLHAVITAETRILTQLSTGAF